MKGITIAPTRQARTAMPSPCTPLLRGVPALLWAILCVVPAAAAATQHVRGIQTSLLRPLAVRGGVLMLPLTAAMPGDQWPATMQLALADGGSIDGVVAWMEAAPPRPARNWTDDPRGLMLRPITAGDDTSAESIAPPLGPYLMARLPSDGHGPIKFQQQSLEPAWADRAAPNSAAGEGDERMAALERTTMPNRPDPHSPFEYWRWVLLAEDLRVPPPAADAYGEPASLLAEHYADLWRLGLARLAARAPETAAKCRSMLTQTASDTRGQIVATWVTDPSQLSALLELLLQPETDPRKITRRAEEWIETIDPIIIWPQRENGGQVRLAIANASDEPMVVKFSWPGLDEIPLATEIGPRMLRSVNVDRAPLPAAPPPGLPVPAEPAQQGLLIEARGRNYGLAFGPRSRAAVPPGVAVGPLHPPLTLTEARARRPMPIPPDHATLVSLRRRHDRWEVLFECRRPVPQEPSEVFDVQSRLDECPTWHATAGTEAVTLLLGDDQTEVAASGMVALTVAESGPIRQFRGPVDGSLEIHRRSWADRWYCRIVLPSAWLSASADRPTLMGFARTHADNLIIDVGPGVTAPWRIEPAPIAIDLTAWRDTP